MKNPMTIEDLALMMKLGFDGMDQQFEGIDQRFEGINQRFEGIDFQLENLNHRVAGNGDHLVRIENRLEAEFAAMRMRFERLESRV